MNQKAKTSFRADLPNGSPPTIDRFEWDFTGVEQAELLACVEWEFPRSVPACRAAVRRLREFSEFALRHDPAITMYEYVSFEEWPAVPFTKLLPGCGEAFRRERLDDLGIPRDLEMSWEMEDGTDILLRQVELLLAYGERNGAEEALRVARSFFQNRDGRPSNTTNECVTLNLDLSKSDDALEAGFRKVIDSLRKRGGIKRKELRGASNSLSQARTKLNQLAAARLLRVMPWQEAYTETLEVYARGLYANRPELWKRAAKKGESILKKWEQEVIIF